MEERRENSDSRNIGAVDDDMFKPMRKMRFRWELWLSLLTMLLAAVIAILSIIYVQQGRQQVEQELQRIEEVWSQSP